MVCAVNSAVTAQPRSLVLAQRGAVSITGALLGGLYGHRALPDWVPTMSWRWQLEDVDAERLLHSIAPRWGSDPINVAVMVHGLLVDERNFLVGRDRLIDAVRPVLKCQPLLVRYNTGQHISENGAALADRLEELLDAWGPRLGRIQLIGHSMGGLVSRAALGHLERRDSLVLDRIDRLTLLATPNQGAELEKIGHAVERALHHAEKLPRLTLRLARGGKSADTTGILRSWARETRRSVADRIAAVPTAPVRSLGALVASRSDGIRDLRYAYLQEREWRLADELGDRLSVSTRRPLAPPSHVDVYAIAGSLWPTVGREPSRYRNDGVVSTASAANKGGDVDELRLVERGRFAEVPMLLHQLVGTSDRAMKIMQRWNERG
ncbi:MAG: pimeloyl-ACP methyl ester carboxylesterase [Bradymonadia bacterium]|jgi:pimeloyl-ACP methyl ester carboxylesterase